MSAMATTQDIEQRRWAAKKSWIFKRDRGVAHTLALEALELLSRAEASGLELAKLNHQVAALLVELEDDLRAEPRARRAVELGVAGSESPGILGNYYLFLAKLLHRLGKPADALPFAKEGLATFLREEKPDQVELDIVRADIQKIEAELR